MVRVGKRARTIVSTTPRQGLPLLREFLSRDDVLVTGGSTYDNAANLAANFITGTVGSYEGTRYGEQEIYGKFLTDVEGATWTVEELQACQINQEEAPLLEQCERVMVGVDPANSESPNADHTGIVIAGRLRNDVFIYYSRRVRMQAAKWAPLVCGLYESSKASRVVVEKNGVGAMAKTVINQHNRAVPVREVTREKGKWESAQPVHQLYASGQVFHVRGKGDWRQHDALEMEMASLTPDSAKRHDSQDDLLDALVHVVTALAVKQRPKLAVVLT